MNRLIYGAVIWNSVWLVGVGVLLNIAVTRQNTGLLILNIITATLFVTSNLIWTRNAFRDGQHSGRTTTPIRFGRQF